MVESQTIKLEKITQLYKSTPLSPRPKFLIYNLVKYKTIQLLIKRLYDQATQIRFNICSTF